jgi:hypothetical protein
MPTLQDLQKSVTNASDAYNNATAALTISNAVAQTRHTELGRCECGKGKAQGKCRPLTYFPSFGSKANIADCTAPQTFDNCVTDCCSKETCQAKVLAYNDAIDALATSTNNVAAAKQKLTTAQAALDSFLKTDPDALNQANTNQLLKIGLYITGAVAVIVAFFWAWKKFIRK